MPTLHWINDDEARKASQVLPYRLLEEVPTLSYGDQQAQNLLIQGDNLAALKSILPYFAGQIKCIYIDPPYNTKSAFAHYDDNLEHSLWLSIMYSRIELLRELLHEWGSIWVSIDDNESHYLKVIMDEIFGRNNFVANVVWQKKYSPQPNAIWLSDSHDHILVYAKNKTVWRPNGLPRTEEMDKRYRNIDNDPRGPWKPSDFTISLTGGQRGAQYAKTGTSTNIYEIVTPSGRKLMPPSGRCWGASPERFKVLLEENRLWFGEHGNNVPAYKRFLSDVQDKSVAKTIWLRDEAGDNQDAKKEVTIFNNEDVFGTPKPEKLLHRILTLGSNPNDIVLDSFLGSGTTAAVAHKMGRRYIGIELGEHAITHCAPRLQKVVDGEQGGISKDVNWQGGGGFRFYRLGEPIFEEDQKINPKITFRALAAHIWFSETLQPYVSPEKPCELLGVHNGTAYYLIYNGVLGDRRPVGGNALTSRILRILPGHDGPKVIYSEVCYLQAPQLRAENITFKKIPNQIEAR